MKQTFLRTVFVCEELHVVYHQYVKIAIFFTELPCKFGIVAVSDTVDQVVCEVFRRRIIDAKLGVIAQNFVADSMQNMRFSKTGHTVNKQRIEVDAGVFRNGARSGCGVLVAVADNKVIEGEILLENDLFHRRVEFFLLFFGLFFFFLKILRDFVFKDDHSAFDFFHTLADRHIERSGIIFVDQVANGRERRTQDQFSVLDRHRLKLTEIDLIANR